MKKDIKTSTVKKPKVSKSKQKTASNSMIDKSKMVTEIEEKENLNNSFFSKENGQEIPLIESIEEDTEQKIESTTVSIKSDSNTAIVDLYYKSVSTHRLLMNNFFYKSFIGLLKMGIEFMFVSFIVITITFFLVNAIPGSSGLTAGLDEASAAAIKHQYGLDLPLIQRYGNYLVGIFHGDFGISTSLYPTVPINDFIWSKFGVSAIIGVISIVITLVIGIPLGIWVGKNPGKLVDNTSTIVIAILISIPSMVFALLLLLLGRAIGLPYIFDINNALSYILPSLALSLSSIIVYVRYIRTELNSELASMHAKFAYLKGVTKRRFVWAHALKPALFPIATFFPMVVLNSFLGSMFIEQVFMIPGAGGTMISAIQAQDNNIVLFMVIIYSVTTILSFTLRDVLYKVLDPRIRRR